MEEFCFFSISCACSSAAERTAIWAEKAETARKFWALSAWKRQFCSWLSATFLRNTLKCPTPVSCKPSSPLCNQFVSWKVNAISQYCCRKTCWKWVKQWELQVAVAVAGTVSSNLHIRLSSVFSRCMWCSSITSQKLIMLMTSLMM